MMSSSAATASSYKYSMMFVESSLLFGEWPLGKRAGQPRAQTFVIGFCKATL